MTAAELAERYLADEGDALTIWEQWICDDPERAWPVFEEIVARRRDDDLLYQVGHRLRLLLWRHWDAFHERAEALVRATPRFERIVSAKFFDRNSYVEKELDVDAFIDAYLLMDDHAMRRYALDNIVKRDAQRGLRLAVEIIHRGPDHGLTSFDTFDPLGMLVDAHNLAVIERVEQLAAESVLVRRALWRMSFNQMPRSLEAAEAWERAIAARGTTTDFTDDEALLPVPQVLSAEDESLIRSWFTHERNFWAFDVMDELVNEKPEEAWPAILRLLDRAKGPTIYSIAAGPLENLLEYHGLDFIDRIAAEARQNATLRQALGGVWLSEECPVFERYKTLMQELFPAT